VVLLNEVERHVLVDRLDTVDEVAAAEAAKLRLQILLATENLSRDLYDTINHIGWGSTGKAVFNLYPYASGRNIGISLQLIGFQIASLEAPKDEMPELAPIAGGFVADGAPVAASSDVLEDF
jgi:hypothetical protein